jgi:predicted amidophosphoribosyltransferase
LLKKSITDFLKDLAIPPTCAVCGKISPDYLCRECRLEILSLKMVHSCRYCGRLLTGQNDDAGHKENICSFCRTGDYNFMVHRSFALYGGNMKKIIKKFKYKKIYNLKDMLIGFLSDIYEEYFRGESIDYIDTVPGKHTEILAEGLAVRHGIPFKKNIVKIRKTHRQGGLGLEEREINILDCFKLRNCLACRDKNILVIDDVWTSGSTLKEVCRTIESGSPKKIFLMTLARGA